MAKATTAFDGANTTHRLEQKGLLQGSSDFLAARELRFLRNRSHHLCRNNAAAVTARNRLTAHWIGTGIKVKWDNKAMQKEWDAFAKSPSIDGWGNLYNLESLWALGFFEDGEIFGRMVLKERKDIKIPLYVQTLQAEQLDVQFTQPDSTRYGITFDEFGKPLIYHFFKSNPQNQSILSARDTLMRIPVDARDVLHIFQRDQPGQWRGIPKLAPVMLALYEIDELVDATLVRQKVAQAIGWVIKKTGAGSLPLIGNVEQVADTTLNDDGSKRDSKLQRILPGGIHYLAEDEEFEFASIDDIGANMPVFLENHWHMIASALDITYEQLTGNLREVNFSSIRAGLIEFRRRVAMTQQLIFINQGLAPLTDRFKELAGLYGTSAMANSTCKFILPKTDWVDPLKDAQADIAEIRAGLATLAEKLAERGVEDIEEHLLQLAKEQGYDVILDSNPKHNTQGSNSINDPEADSATQKPKKKPTKKVTE